MATVYPSDAPLPEIHVNKLSATPYPTSIYVEVDSVVANNQTMRDWLGPRGFCETVFRLINDAGFWFIDGISQPPPGSSANPLVFSGMHFGKWVTVQATSIFLYPPTDPGYGPFIFDLSSPLYLFDVYVPFPSELTPGVWTDLQFKQGNGGDLTPLLVIGGLGVAGAVAYYLWRKKK